MHRHFHGQSIRQRKPINEAYQQLLACTRCLGFLTQMAERLHKSTFRTKLSACMIALAECKSANTGLHPLGLWLSCNCSKWAAGLCCSVFP